MLKNEQLKTEHNLCVFVIGKISNFDPKEKNASKEKLAFYFNRRKVEAKNSKYDWVNDY